MCDFDFRRWDKINVENYPVFRQTLQLSSSGWIYNGWVLMDAGAEARSFSPPISTSKPKRAMYDMPCLRFRDTPNHYTIIVNMANIILAETSSKTQEQRRVCDLLQFLHAWAQSSCFFTAYQTFLYAVIPIISRRHKRNCACAIFRGCWLMTSSLKMQCGCTCSVDEYLFCTKIMV